MNDLEHVMRALEGDPSVSDLGMTAADADALLCDAILRPARSRDALQNQAVGLLTTQHLLRSQGQTIPLPEGWASLPYVGINFRPAQRTYLVGRTLGDWFGYRASNIGVYAHRAKAHFLHGARDVSARLVFCGPQGLLAAQGAASMIKTADKDYLAGASRAFSINEYIGSHGCAGLRGSVVVCPLLHHTCFERASDTTLFTVPPYCASASGIDLCYTLDTLDQAVARRGLGGELERRHHLEILGGEAVQRLQ